MNRSDIVIKQSNKFTQASEKRWNVYKKGETFTKKGETFTKKGETFTNWGGKQCILLRFTQLGRAISIYTPNNFSYLFCIKYIVPNASVLDEFDSLKCRL